MEVKVAKTAKIKLSVDELKQFIIANFDTLELDGVYIDNVNQMKVTSITDIQKTEWEQGGDPHDAWSHEVFDGLEITLEG